MSKYKQYRIYYLSLLLTLIIYLYNTFLLHKIILLSKWLYSLFARTSKNTLIC